MTLLFSLLPEVPILLVGTQSDLPNETTSSKEFVLQRNLCEMELGSVGYVECSAKTHQGVQEVMEEVIRKVIMCREKSRKKKKCCDIESYIRLHGCNLL